MIDQMKINRSSVKELGIRVMYNSQWLINKSKSNKYQPISVLLAMSLLMSPQLQAEATYYKTDNSNHSANSSSHVYYPPVRHKDNNRTSIITVTKAKTGAHVVLGGTVTPYREVTLTAQASRSYRISCRY